MKQWLEEDLSEFLKKTVAWYRLKGIIIEHRVIVEADKINFKTKPHGTLP